MQRFSSARLTGIKTQNQIQHILSASPIQQEEGETNQEEEEGKEEEEEALLFEKRPIPLNRMSSPLYCSPNSHSIQSKDSNSVEICNDSNDRKSPNKFISSRPPFSHTVRTPSISRSDTSASTSDAVSTSSFLSSNQTPTTPNSQMHPSSSSPRTREQPHACRSLDPSPKRPTISLLSAALLQDDLNEGPQIRAAHWNQACGILRKGMEGVAGERKMETMGVSGKSDESETKQEQEVAKRPSIKAHFVEPQKPIREERRRVSLPPRIVRPTLSLSPEEDLEDGPASLGQNSTSTSSFIKRGQTTDSAYSGIFSSGIERPAQPQRGRSLVFQEPPQQDRRSGARQASLSNVSQQSSPRRPSILSTKSEDGQSRPSLHAQASTREVASDGEFILRDGLIPLKSPLFGKDRSHLLVGDGLESTPVEKADQMEDNQLADPMISDSQENSEDSKQHSLVRPQVAQLHSFNPTPSQIDSTATPSASRKTKLTFASSPTAATDRRTSRSGSDRLPHIGEVSLRPNKESGETKSNLSSEDEGAPIFSDRIFFGIGTKTQEQSEKRSSLNTRSSSTATKMSSSPAHARPLTSRERINSRSSSKSSSPPPSSTSKHLKGKMPVTSRSPAHANLKTRNIMPYLGHAADEDSDEDDQDSEEEQSCEDDSEESDSQLEETDSAEDEEEEEEEEDSMEDEEDSDAELTDSPGGFARKLVISEFHEAKLNRNHSLSMTQDDDSSSIIAPSVDSRDLAHPMSFLPSTFDEILESSSSQLSFEDLSTQNQMKSFVREQQSHLSSPPAFSQNSGGTGSVLGNFMALGKRRNLNLKLPVSFSGGKKGAEERVFDSESRSNTSSSTPNGSPRLSSPPLPLGFTSPKTPKTLSSGLKPSTRRTPSQPSCEVSTITQIAQSPPRSSGIDAWHTLRHCLETPSTSTASSTPMGGGGGFFHLNHLHQQLDREEQQQESELQRVSYLRSKSQGSSRIRATSSNDDQNSYFNHNPSQIVRSAPSTPPISSFIASSSKHAPPSALDLMNALNLGKTQVRESQVDPVNSSVLTSSEAAVQTLQPQKSITIVSTLPFRNRDGSRLVSTPSRRRPRTAGSDATPSNNNPSINGGSLHFNKQELLDRFDPRRRRRSGGVTSGKET